MTTKLTNADLVKAALMSGGINAVINGLINWFQMRGKNEIFLTVDSISTTEHTYISPPSRIFSSLLKLSGFSNKKVLRIVLTDNFSYHPEHCVKQICIPHFLNKKLLYMALTASRFQTLCRLLSF